MDKIANRLLHFSTEEELNNVINSIASSSIAFVDNPPIIYTHGVKFYCGLENILYVAQRLSSSIDNAKTDLENKIRTAVNNLNSQLSPVAFSGDYSDLSNKPTIPSLTNYYTKQLVDNLIAGAVASNAVDLSPIYARLSRLENEIITWLSSN